MKCNEIGISLCHHRDKWKTKSLHSSWIFDLAVSERPAFEQTRRDKSPLVLSLFWGVFGYGVIGCGSRAAKTTWNRKCDRLREQSRAKWGQDDLTRYKRRINEHRGCVWILTSRITLRIQFDVFIFRPSYYADVLYIWYDAAVLCPTIRDNVNNLKISLGHDGDGFVWNTMFNDSLLQSATENRWDGHFILINVPNGFAHKTKLFLQWCVPSVSLSLPSPGR